MDAPRIQHDIDEEEWKNPENWGRATFLLPIYFSKRDSRLFVPWGPFGNKTVNLGHRFGWTPALLFYLSMLIAAFCGGMATGRQLEAHKHPDWQANMPTVKTDGLSMKRTERWQPEVWHLALIAVLVSAWILCGIVSGVYGLLASRNTKKGRRRFPFLQGSIFGMWPKDDFTEIGLKYRAASLKYDLWVVIIFCFLVLTLVYSLQTR